MKKYPSRYSRDKMVTGAQYIIELVCEKNAMQTQRELPQQFWQLPEWAAFYKSQLRKCHMLLKKYSDEAIIKALNDPKAFKIYSLFAPWLEEIIIKYQKQIDTPKEVVKLPDIGVDKFSRPQFGKKNKRNILEEIDGEEESFIPGSDIQF